MILAQLTTNIATNAPAVAQAAAQVQSSGERWLDFIGALAVFLMVLSRAIYGMSGGNNVTSSILSAFLGSSSVNTKPFSISMSLLQSTDKPLPNTVTPIVPTPPKPPTA